MTFAAQQFAARVRYMRALGLVARRRRVPRSRPPRLIESDYAGRLVAIVDRMRAVTDRLLPGILAGLPRADGIRSDEGEAARGRREVERARIEIEDGINVTQLEGIAAEMARRTSEHQRGELARQAKAALGIDVVTLDPRVPSLIEGFVHENAKLIVKLKNTTLDELEAIVTRAYASGTRAEAVAAEIAARYGIAERHARLIARDQIGKLNGAVSAARHREIGIASFVWRSMGDNKVRPRHVHLDGQRFTYDKPPAEGLPGQPIACRCTQEPVFDDLVVAAAAPDPAIARPAAPLASAAEPPPIVWERKKNPKRVAAAKKAAEASAERRREIYSAVASNLPQELQAAWQKEGHKFLQQEAARIRGEKDRINAASKISEAFAEQYGSGAETGYEGDRYHRRAEIEAKGAEEWADEQERRYYEAAMRDAEQQRPAPTVPDDDEVPF